MIHYGQQPMNDFGCTQKGVSVDGNYSNFFKKAFPCLFPYEEDGILHNQPTNINFNNHVKWLLLHHDC